uniref:NB-ARC domain-containing protein n=1 Tax=Leersia perrieri TaxID=77586 RepID=A0A0D9XTZ9_9ORYZ
METSSSAFMEEKEEVLRLLETLLQRISKLLESGRLADARRRHCFAFMKMELAVVVESLRPSLARDRGVVVEDDWRPWLTELRLLDRDMERLLLHPPDHPLLTRCFGRRMDLHNQIQFEAYRLHLAAEEHPCNHHHEHHIDLPISSGDHQLGLRDDRLVGVAAPAKKLLEWLTVGADQYSDNNSLRVMAIVGPAGVGKTTLAMELYRRLQRRRRTGEDFECRAVASFSRRRDDQPVRRKLLLRSILSQITGMEASTSSRHTSAATAWDEERLAFKIWKYLRYKR